MNGLPLTRPTELRTSSSRSREGLRRPGRLDPGLLAQRAPELVVGECEHAAVGDDDPDGAFSISHLKLGEAVLELFAYRDHRPAPSSASELATDLPRVGTKHFGLRVASVEDAKATLADRGIEALGDIHEGKTKVRYFFVKDPSGNFVELVQDDRGL